ncbi:hypothetical protein HPB49_007307 [Dermacentor silvarum]|uniref:Uncharacterized protein n=1 Tax=Dermacentor silvarum TaxID=543639 RepID=A0ACB8C2I2_DERSI|nr:hypothetical protein HPB49_007307 [Dermacentor silvarum]
MANADERSAYNERLIDAVEHELAEVKARWKNLRDTFRRVLKDRARASKSGAPADDVLDESTKWVFFSRLMFLKDTMEGRPTSSNLEPQSQIEESLCDVETAQEILEGIYMEKEVSTSESTEPLEALPAESCATAHSSKHVLEIRVARRTENRSWLKAAGTVLDGPRVENKGPLSRDTREPTSTSTPTRLNDQDPPASNLTSPAVESAGPSTEPSPGLLHDSGPTLDSGPHNGDPSGQSTPQLRRSTRLRRPPDRYVP